MVKQMVNGAMEMLHDQSLPTIELLQTSFPENKQFMINISTFFDPRYVFLIYLPLLFALNKRIGHRLVIALTLTEWTNQILKWLLAGERPYWYVHERSHELANATIAANAADLTSEDSLAVLRPLARLRQFPVTCELGAGSPSGHAMVTATVWYILIDALLKGELMPTTAGSADKKSPVGQAIGRAMQQDLSRFAKLAGKLSWSLYGLALMMVSLSRVYLACHFPHQCLGGACLGILVAWLVVERLPLERVRASHFVVSTCVMFGCAMATYGLLRMLGVDPLWSVGKGMRWCVKKEYIHLDTTPFFSMMRYLGVGLGAGLAYNGTRYARGSKSSSSATMTARGVAALASLLFGHLLMSAPMPSKSQQNLYYVSSFLVYVLFAYGIAGPIPSVVKKLTGSRVQQSKQPKELCR